MTTKTLYYPRIVNLTKHGDNPNLTFSLASCFSISYCPLPVLTGSDTGVQIAAVMKLSANKKGIRSMFMSRLSAMENPSPEMLYSGQWLVVYLSGQSRNPQSSGSILSWHLNAVLPVECGSPILFSE